MYARASNANPTLNTEHIILNLAVYSAIDLGVLSVPAPAALPDSGNGLHGTPCPDVPVAYLCSSLDRRFRLLPRAVAPTLKAR